MKRAQAAMEFLMTYGWAILVVLAAIGALAYFGVLSPDRFLPERCTGPAGMDCLEKASIDSNANTISFASKNNLGNSINITAVNVSSSDCTLSSATVTVDSTTYTIPAQAAPVTNAQNFVVEVTCTSLATGRTSADISLTYLTQETGLSHKAAYSIAGKAS
ncbi:MAG: hypothetical protein GXP63_03460 [DPANN group archaeon]|nr:hypothetical protein [DPANN group archaeon]